MSRSRKKWRYVAPALIGIAFVAMLAWTWLGWPDPLVDFGRELYVPWQLSEGKVLYRDIAYFNGPLSPYFNSLLFRILGVSLRTLVVANIAIAAAVVVMIWKLFRLAGDRISAMIACLLFITLFMSTQYVPLGNYNWITPYSHELTHGVALSLAAILAMTHYMVRPSVRRAGLVGVLIGIVFLTKPEVFAAVGPIVALAMLSRQLRRPSSVRAFLLGAIIPPILSVVLLSIAMPINEAARNTLGGWMYAFDSRVTHLNFYRASMGMDDAYGNTIRALLQLAGYLGALGPAIVIDWIILQNRASRRVRVIVPTTYATALALAIWRLHIVWPDVFRGLPFLLAIALFPFCVVRLRRTRAILQSILIVFALLLNFKLLLAVRIYHYGFALAMPALLVGSALFVSWIPRWMKFRRPATMQVAAIAALSLVVVVYLRAYSKIYSQKPAVVAKDTADEFRADAMGQLVNDIVETLKPLPAETTIAVVPQGVMINYLSGKVNPTPYFTLMPPEVLMFGDDKIAAAHKKNPPDILVLVATDLGEYGFRTMDEFAPKTTAWLREHYQPIRTFTSPGLPPVTILRRDLTKLPSTMPR